MKRHRRRAYRAWQMATSPDVPGQGGQADAPASPSSSADSPAFPPVPATVGRLETVDVGPIVRGADGLPLPPGMADGARGDPPPLPPADPAIFVCMRGPCRYLWEMQVHFDTGNPADTWHPTRGLREGLIQCPACQGTGHRVVTAELATPGQPACGYQPAQGSHRGHECRLVQDHEGAHFYASTKPLPLRQPCPRCAGVGTVADPSGRAIRQPRKITRSCIRQPGVEQDLDDTVVYQCNQWDPAEVARSHRDEREERRKAYLERHPDLLPPE